MAMAPSSAPFLAVPLPPLPYSHRDTAPCGDRVAAALDPCLRPRPSPAASSPSSPYFSSSAPLLPILPVLLLERTSPAPVMATRQEGSGTPILFSCTPAYELGGGHGGPCDEQMRSSPTTRSSGGEVPTRPVSPSPTAKPRPLSPGDRAAQAQGQGWRSRVSYAGQAVARGTMPPHHQSRHTAVSSSSHARWSMDLEQGQRLC